MNKYMLAILLSLGVSFAYADEKKKDDAPCAKNAEIEKVMQDKGYSLLLNMTRNEDNKEGIVESLWIGGSDAVITATLPKGEVSCFVTSMKNTIINPLTVEMIWENYKKQTKQKDI